MMPVVANLNQPAIYKNALCSAGGYNLMARMILKRLISASLVFLATSPAFAVEQGGVSDDITAATITTSSGNCLGANGNRRSLTIDATAATQNIGYCETSPATPNVPCTAAIGTVGTSTLFAGQQAWWAAGSAPQNQMCFVSASGSQPLTIREGK